MAISTHPRSAPGTELLYHQSGNNDLTASDGSPVQHVKHGDGRIILVPQPSRTDPNDPLRWPTWLKWSTFLNALGYAFMGGVTGPIMAAMMIPLSERFGQSLQRMSYANGATLVCQGVGNVFWMPLAIKFGRRPVYIISNTLMGVACIWLGVASNASYTPFIIGRAFLGLFEAPIESIVPSTIIDIFFLHNRGARISMYGLSVLGGNELGPLFSAIIFQALGSQWAFFIVAIFIFSNSLTMFLLMPETRYLGSRPVISLTSNGLSAAEKPRGKEGIEKVENVSGKATGSFEGAGLEHVPPQNQIPKRSFLVHLALFEAPDKNASLRKDFLRPFVLLTYPTILWTCLIYGASLGWNVILGASVAQLFEPQYGFDSQSQGLVFLSPFIGSLVGTWLCGPMADSVANYYTRRNEGIREPEMRLPTCAIAAVLTFLGALVAALAYHYNTHWIGPIMGIGILSAGAQMGASLSMTYASDCHTDVIVELMVAVASLKSLIAWIWTWVINDWIAAQGMLVAFMTVAAVDVVLYLSTFLLYLYGKRIRIWIYEYDMLARAGLR
ncbi:putative Major facilitator superfamily (MFS) profile domain-containing protein [Seiridium cardinale]|uniref:Major facilitator superfamily (MFS) profile domain-containing protein n=1 Tax=Seiridium cardinale TaxID=138064 RepID=A0ABR2Y8A3_9PEZI